MLRNLGYPCINMELNERGIFTGRTCRKDTFTIDKASELALANCRDLCRIIAWNNALGIKYFRVGSEIFPFIDHPILFYGLHKLKDESIIRARLADAGSSARLLEQRLSCHPGPYTVLASDKIEVVSNAIRTLNSHAMLGTLLGYVDPGFFKVNIHVGTGVGGKKAAADRFCRNFEMLSPEAQKCLTVENDDRASLFSVKDLYDLIYKRIKIPICFDIHHYRFVNDGMEMQEAAAMAFETWGAQCPEVHYSESREEGKTAHSDYIKGPIPELSTTVTYDVMIEAKMKERALRVYQMAAK